MRPAVLSTVLSIHQRRFEDCVRLSKKALALDPNFGSAHAILGWSYNSLAVYYSEDPQRLIEQALAAAEKAIAFESSKAQGLTLISQQRLREGRHEEAVALTKEALSLSPNSADTHFMHGRALLFSGQAREAIAQTEQAMRISPLYPGYLFANLVEGHRIAGDLDQALKWGRLMVEYMPESYVSHLRLAGILSLLGYDQEALETIRKIMTLHPGVSLSSFATGNPYKNPQHLDPLIEALRKLGLPE